jgi:hypothetical protein
VVTLDPEEPARADNSFAASRCERLMLDTSKYSLGRAFADDCCTHINASYLPDLVLIVKGMIGGQVMYYLVR